MIKGPYDTDIRPYTFAAAMIGIVFGAMTFCALFNLSDLIWRITLFVVSCVITFAYDNSGLRSGLLRGLFKNKVFSEWLQRDNVGLDVFTEALKTVTYFLLALYVNVSEKKLQISIWIILVALNLIMYVRYLIKSDLYYENYIKCIWTVQKSMALSSLAWLFCLNQTTSVSIAMCILAVSLIVLFVLLLLVINRTGKIKHFQVMITIAVIVLFCFGLVRSADYVFEYREPQFYQTEIVAKYKKDIPFFRRRQERTFFEIEDWNKESDYFVYHASQEEFALYEVGDTVEVRQGKGALGGIWYEIITFQK